MVAMHSSSEKVAATLPQPFQKDQTDYSGSTLVRSSFVSTYLDYPISESLLGKHRVYLLLCLLE